MMRKMKDSGVEWIGEIPDGWILSKMKYIGEYINGYAFKPEDWCSTGRPIIRIQDLTGSTDNPNYFDGKLKLEYYKLKETFRGELILEDQKGVFDPATQTGATGKEKKEPLDEIIEKINQRFKGEFTEGDRVLISSLQTKLMRNKKLEREANSKDPQIFLETTFKEVFDEVAVECYHESTDTFNSLFANKNKYNAILNALAEVIYRDMRMAKQVG